MISAQVIAEDEGMAFKADESIDHGWRILLVASF
jgi:hypothetical protein